MESTTVQPFSDDQIQQQANQVEEAEYLGFVAGAKWMREQLAQSFPPNKYTALQIAQFMGAGEPLFILRPKDALTLDALHYFISRYRLKAPEAHGEDTKDFKIQEVIDAIMAWQREHGDQVKYPTI